MLFYFTERARTPDLMDLHESDISLIPPTLYQLARINFWISGIRGVIKKHIINSACKENLKTITIAELGCGGCDVSRWLVTYGKRIGLDIQVYGIDHDERICEIAKEQCKLYPEIKIINGSALDLSVLPSQVDYIFANHMAHHIDNEYMTDLLVQMGSYSKRGFLINDLVRSKGAFVAFFVFARLMFRSGFTVHDGLNSIRRGFTQEELMNFWNSTNLDGHADIYYHGFGHIAFWAPKKC